MLENLLQKYFNICYDSSKVPGHPAAPPETSKISFFCCETVSRPPWPAGRTAIISTAIGPRQNTPNAIDEKVTISYIFSPRCHNFPAFLCSPVIGVTVSAATSDALAEATVFINYVRQARKSDCSKAAFPKIVLLHMCMTCFSVAI